MLLSFNSLVTGSNVSVLGIASFRCSCLLKRSTSFFRGFERQRKWWNKKEDRENEIVRCFSICFGYAQLSSYEEVKFARTNNVVVTISSYFVSVLVYSLCMEFLQVSKSFSFMLRLCTYFVDLNAISVWLIAANRDIIYLKQVWSIDSVLGLRAFVVCIQKSLCSDDVEICGYTNRHETVPFSPC